MAQDRTQYYQQLYDTDPVLNEAVQRYRKYAADPSPGRHSLGKRRRAQGSRPDRGRRRGSRRPSSSGSRSWARTMRGITTTTSRPAKSARAGFLGRNADWLIPGSGDRPRGRTSAGGGRRRGECGRRLGRERDDRDRRWNGRRWGRGRRSRDGWWRRRRSGHRWRSGGRWRHPGESRDRDRSGRELGADPHGDARQSAGRAPERQQERLQPGPLGVAAEHGEPESVQHRTGVTGAATQYGPPGVDCRELDARQL